MSMDLSHFTANIRHKFHEDGSPRDFPGNTIISKVDSSMAIYPELCRIAQAIRSHGQRDHFSWLPEPSYHMTVIEGVCDQNRQESFWTGLLPPDAPLETVDALFYRRFQDIAPLPETRMRWTHIQLSAALKVGLEPDTKTDRAQLSAYRDDVSDRLRLRFPNHDTYQFHISLAYTKSVPTEKEWEAIQQIIEKVNAYMRENPQAFVLNPPRLCGFKDMFEFSPLEMGE